MRNVSVRYEDIMKAYGTDIWAWNNKVQSIKEVPNYSKIDRLDFRIFEKTIESDSHKIGPDIFSQPFHKSVCTNILM